MDGSKLVIRLNEREFIFEELLLFVIGSARKTFIDAPCGVDLEKIISDFLDGFFCARYGLFPFIAAEP